MKLPAGSKSVGVNLGALMPPKPSKYRAVPTEYGGVRYSSKAEAAYAEFLDVHPEVAWWIGQPKFRLGCPENVYVADFVVMPCSGKVYVVDVKGHRTPKFQRDVKLWKAYGPCPLLIVSGKTSEWIYPKAAIHKESPMNEPLTPEELKQIVRTYNGGSKDITHLAAALREAWAERDQLEAHLEAIQMTLARTRAIHQPNMQLYAAIDNPPGDKT